MSFEEPSPASIARTGRYLEADMLAAAAAVVLVVTLIPWGAWAGFRALGFAPGAPALASAPILPWTVWLIAAAHVPAALVTRRRHRRGARLWTGVAALELTQFAWIQAVTWCALPYVPLIAMALLFAMSITWTFNDALVLYDATPLRLIHALSVPLFDLGLLAVDLVGGRGLLHAYRLAPSTILSFVAIQLVLAALAQAIVATVGRQAREVDARIGDQSALLAERALLQRVAGVLGQGLRVGRFSHDIAGPVTALSGQLQVVEEALRAAKHDDPLLAEDARESVAEMRVAAQRILDMTALLARSLRHREETSLVEATTLVARALGDMRVALHGHGIDAAKVALDVEGGTVHAADGHVAALANLLTNAVLQAPGSPVQLRGRPLSAWFYALDLRDRATPIEGRELTLERIRRALQLEPDARELGGEPPPYRGHGVGLMMAKIVAMRHRGWISARAPAEGPGIELRVVVPRVAPELLPSEADERAAAEGWG